MHVAPSACALDTDFLDGGGEMAELIRSRDWSATPLGPIESWPQSLKTATSLVLPSKFAMVIAWGPEFVFLYNDRYRPVLGAKHPAALGKAAADIFPEVWDDLVGPLFRKATTEEALAVDDLLIPLDRNGFLEECYFTLSYSPIRDESGGVGGLLAVVAETTERVLGERGLRTLRDLAACASQAKTEVHAMTEAARVLGENRADIPFALCYLVEPDGKNARLVASAGIDSAPAIAPARLALGSREPWPLLLDTPLEVVEGIDARFTLPAGIFPEPCKRAVVLSIGRPGLPHPYGFVVLGTNPRRALDESYRTFFTLAAEHIATSITNARAMEQERKRAEALAEIDRAKTAFFSNISHEFRTPLTLMLGPTEDALASPDRCLRGEQLDAMYRNELRLLKLVNSLLDFARIEAGRVDACYRPTDLATLTADLASTFRSTIEKAGVAFEVECTCEEPIWVDEGMWEKIVLNLLSNAFKFTFEGSIRVQLRCDADAAYLTVSDTGTGVPADELPRLFERFHRVHGARSRTHEGSGIGLALVHELVRLHGGNVQVESEVGKGSAFTVKVPRGNAHLAAERLGTERALATTEVAPAAYVEEASHWLTSKSDEPECPTSVSGRVLVVDDNADMREYLRRLLASHFAVDTAVDGVAALQAVETNRPDVIVSDVMMPNLDGFGMLRELRRMEPAPRVPVILVSARAGEESRVEGIEAGADDYVVKPFSARELVARVKTQIDLAQLRAQAERERAGLAHQIRISTRLNRIGRALNGGLDLQRILQLVTDEATELCEANFGAFFYNVSDQRGESYFLYTLAGAPPEAFSQFPLPRKTPVFEPTFRGESVVRSDDIRRDPRYGKNAPYFGMPPGHLPVVSYLAVPVLSARGGVIGALFFGHREVGIFTEEHEQLIIAVAAQAATAIENARLYAEAETARRDAESASRAKDEFLAILGHELRNPLTPIKTALHLMGRDPVAPFRREREIIDRQVDHMARLVDDLLDVSRITRSKIELRKQLVDLAHIVVRTLEVAGPLFEKYDHEIATSIEPGLIVEADETRLAQVITNLVTNAAKYTPRGGRIEVRAQREHGEVVLRVRDNGIGIPADMLSHVFDLFAQERQSIARSDGGLGLGLAIVRSLVTMHGGSVHVSSDGRGRGSEFTVRLPASAYAAAPNRQEPKPSLVEVSRLRVLVVDDNVDAAELLAESLRDMGHDTAVAFDGAEALRVADQFKPQIALLDIGLPVMDGYEVARQLSNSSEYRPALLVAITGYGLEADRQKSQEAGFAAHLIKPVRVQTLREILAQAHP